MLEFMVYAIVSGMVTAAAGYGLVGAGLATAAGWLGLGWLCTLPGFVWLWNGRVYAARRREDELLGVAYPGRAEWRKVVGLLAVVGVLLAVVVGWLL